MTRLDLLPQKRTFLLTYALSAAVAVSCFALGCGGTETAEVNKPAATPDETGAAKPTKPTPSQVDRGPDAEQAFTWVLAKLVDGGGLTDAEIGEWFSPAFLKQVPPDRLKPVFKQLAEAAPFKELKRSSEGRALNVLLDTSQGGIRVIITVDTSIPRQIDGLVFRSATTEAPPKTYGDAVAVLKDAGANFMYSVSEIKKSQCIPYQNNNATARLAIGSTFKLWVLATLNKTIKSRKKLTWDTKMPIEDAFKSLPSGVLQDSAAGTQLTLREYATKMISISDNTATDHLINFVGRKAVEKMLRTSGHEKKSVNIPFLMTRELFALKLVASADEVLAYRKANVKGKLKLLKELHKKELKLEMAADWKKPKDLDLEWFANGVELCRVMTTIGNQSNWKTDSEALKVLSVNPGVAYDKAHWKYLGFKGGSEPGVMNLTFLGKRHDDRWFVVAMTVNDASKPLNESAVANAAVGTLNVLGAETK